MRFLRLILIDIKEEFLKNFNKAESYLLLIKNLVERDIAYIEYMESNGIINMYISILNNLVQQRII